MLPNHRNTLTLACLLTSATAYCGCVHLPANPGYTGPAPLPAHVAAQFAYTKRPPVDSTQLLKKTRHYTIKRIRFESQVNVVDGHTITLDYYEPLAPHRKTPAIVVLPIHGGSNMFAKIFAHHFASHQFAAIIVHRQRQYKHIDEIDALNLSFQQIVLDHKQVVDWIESQPAIDKNRIGLFGISAGGIKASLLQALERRFSASVIALAGGDLPYLFCYSPERGLVKSRKKAMRKHNLSADELFEMLHKRFKHDPLRYAMYADTHNTLLILGAFDRVVPFAKGLELREAFGKPQTIIVPCGHYGSIVFTPMIKEMAASHFRKTLMPVKPNRTDH